MTKNKSGDRVHRAIETHLSHAFPPGVKTTVVTHTHMRAATVDFLRKLQERGDIPDDVNVDDTQIVPDEIDPRTIDVQLPWLLRLYLQDGLESVRTPRFKHDSDCCRFLAHGLGCDLYYCGQSGHPTVIARQSSEPSDYMSGISAAAVSDEGEPLHLALRIAAEGGLVERH
jgi:hypothetical protein